MRVLLLLQCVSFAVSSPFTELETSGQAREIAHHGFDMKVQKTLVFDLQTCGSAHVQMEPFDDNAPFYRFCVNTSSDPIGRLKKCVFTSDQVLNCFEVVNLDLEPSCNESKTYWIRIDGADIIVGKGHTPGCDVLNLIQNDGPFNVQYVLIVSRESSKWKLWNNTSESSGQEPCSTTDTSTSETSVTTGSAVGVNCVHHSKSCVLQGSVPLMIVILLFIQYSTY